MLETTRCYVAIRTEENIKGRKGQDVSEWMWEGNPTLGS